MCFNTYEEALKACIKADKDTEMIDEIFEIEINQGVVIENKKIR